MGYKFCPYCGGELKLFKQHFKCESCSKKIYMNSKPAAGVIILKGNKFLITKRSVDPMKGYYDVIGGFANKDELPEECATRETLEETGLDIKVTKLLGMYIEKSYKYQNESVTVLVIVYLAEIIGGKIKAQDDVASLHWFPIDRPPKKLAFKWLDPAMKDLQKYYKLSKK